VKIKGGVNLSDISGNRLHETYIVRGDDVSNVPVSVIPVQNGLTQQIINL
jgi:hypothetical protein